MYFRFFLKIGSDVIFVKLTSRLFRTSTPFTESECLVSIISSMVMHIKFWRVSGTVTE